MDRNTCSNVTKFSELSLSKLSRREVLKRRYHPGARLCLPTWVTLAKICALGKERISFVYHRPGNPCCREAT